jgi:hypothetical protein
MGTHEYEVKVIGGAYKGNVYAHYETDSVLDFTDWVSNAVSYYKSAIGFDNHPNVTFMVEIVGKHGITSIDLVKQKTGEVNVIEH